MEAGDTIYLRGNRSAGLIGPQQRDEGAPRVWWGIMDAWAEKGRR